MRDPGYIESVLCLQVSAHISIRKALRANFQALALLPYLFDAPSNHYPSKISSFQISSSFLDEPQLMAALTSEGSFATIPPQKVSGAGAASAAFMDVLR